MVVKGYMERTSGVEFILFTTKEEFIYKLFLHPQYHNSPSRIFHRTILNYRPGILFLGNKSQLRYFIIVLWGFLGYEERQDGGVLKRAHNQLNPEQFLSLH